MGNRRALAAAIAMTAITFVPNAWSQSAAPSIVNPDAAIKRAVAADSRAIDDLVRRALNPSGTTADRVSAVNGLAGLYFDYLLANGEQLVKDQNASVAQASVLHLAGQIAMLSGSHGGSHNHDPAPNAYDEYQAQLVQASLRLVRLALDHSSALVRNEAASALSSRGDVQGLARIQTLVDDGRLSPRDGIGYLSLAPLDIAGP